MSWEDFPGRFSRRRRFPFFGDSFFEDIDAFMRDMEKEMEEMFREFSGRAPRNLVRERRLLDGSIAREVGPLVYGYSMTIGPDGKPVVREFGNIKPGLKPFGFGFERRPSIDVKSEREPLVDVIPSDADVKVIAELPGVDKNDIKLDATAKTLTIKVDTENRKYHKELELPAEVDPATAKTSYKNGVLEVTFARVRERKPKGVPIKIE